MDSDAMLEALGKATRQLRMAQDAIESEDWINACRSLGRVADLIPDVSTELAVRAVASGRTQKDVAVALGVPPSALRGIREVING